MGLILPPKLRDWTLLSIPTIALADEQMDEHITDSPLSVGVEQLLTPVI